MPPPSSNERAVGRINQLAEQLGVTPTQLKIGAGAVVGAGAAIVAGTKRAPVQLELPPKNTPDTIAVYQPGQQHWTSDATAEMPIRYSKSGPGKVLGLYD